MVLEKRLGRSSRGGRISGKCYERAKPLTLRHALACFSRVSFPPPEIQRVLDRHRCTPTGCIAMKRTSEPLKFTRIWKMSLRGQPGVSNNDLANQNASRQPSNLARQHHDTMTHLRANPKP